MKDLKKLFKNLKHKYLGIGFLLVLCNASLLGVGFSSWVMTGGISTEANINVEVGDIKYQSKDYKGTAFYIKDSENYFGYYKLDDKKHLTDNKISLTIEINPSEAKKLITEDLEINLAFKYIAKTALNINLFEDNSYVVSPKSIAFTYLPSNDTFYCSNVITTVNSIDTENSEYKIETSTRFLSENNPSLCNYFEFYSSNKSIQLNASLNFEILDEEIFVSKLSQITSAELLTSLPEKV